MVTSGTGLVTEEARPPGSAGALSRQRVTAEAGGQRTGHAQETGDPHRGESTMGDETACQRT